jgi:hypothetical protein
VSRDSSLRRVQINNDFDLERQLQRLMDENRRLQRLSKRLENRLVQASEEMSGDA